MVEPGSPHLRFGHLGVTPEFENFIINSNKNSEYLRLENQYESDYSEQSHGGDCWLVNFWPRNLRNLAIFPIISENRNKIGNHDILVYINY
jgi:hypothetical protein